MSCDSMIRCNSITDNKRFWKTVKPFLLEKITNASQIAIEEKTKLSLMILNYMRSLAVSLKMLLNPKISVPINCI